MQRAGIRSGTPNRTASAERIKMRRKQNVPRSHLAFDIVMKNGSAIDEIALVLPRWHRHANGHQRMSPIPCRGDQDTPAKTWLSAECASRTARSGPVAELFRALTRQFAAKGRQYRGVASPGGRHHLGGDTTGLSLAGDPGRAQALPRMSTGDRTIQRRNRVQTLCPGLQNRANRIRFGDADWRKPDAFKATHTGPSSG